MGLFEDIYNTVARFFRPQEIQEGEDTKSVATNRLKLVLMQDRTNLTPRILEQMRSELIDLLSRYVELDKELLELNFEQEGDQVALMLSIPVIRAKDEDEIEEAIRAHKEAMKAEETEVDEDEEESEDEEITEEETSDEAEETDEEEAEEEVVAEEEQEEIVDSEEESEEEESSETVQTVTTPEGMTSSKQEDISEETEEVSKN